MNRLILWVYRYPGAIVLTIFAIVLPLAAGMFRLSFETNYINLFRPETRVVKDYHTVESRLGGIGLVELVVPVGPSLSPRTLKDLKSVEDRIRQIRVSDPHAIAQVTLAGHGTRPGWTTGGAARGSSGAPAGRQARADRGLAASKSCYSSFWNAKAR